MLNKIIRYVGIFSVLLMFVISPTTTALNSVSAQTAFKEYFPIIAYDRSPYFLNGLDGGTIEGIAIDPNDSSILYAGSWGNGIYKSTDGGQTWVSKNKGLQSPYIYEITIDPHDSQHIFVSAYEHGINETRDGGETWTDASTGIPDGSVIYSIDFDPTNSDVIYAALREETIYIDGVPDYPGGVYKSINGGEKWVKKSNGLSYDYVYDLAIDPNDPNIIYTAMHDTGVFKTIDGGNHWKAKLQNLVWGDIRSVDILPDSSRVYIGHWDGYGVSYSDNAGDTWVNVRSTNSSDLSVYEVLIDQNHPSTVYLSTFSGLYRCENPMSYSTCQQIAYKNVLVFDLALDLNGGTTSSGLTKYLYTGLQHYAIHKSDNAGKTFDPIYYGIRANIINSLIINPYYPAIQYLSSYGRGVFKTEDNGQTWFPLRDRSTRRFTNEIVFRPDRYNVIYAVADYSSIYWSTDGGGSWLVGDTDMIYSQDVQEMLGDTDYQYDPGSSSIYNWMDPVDQEELLNVNQTDKSMAREIIPNFTTLGFNADPNKLAEMVVGTSNNGIKLSDDYGRSWFNAFSTSKPVYDFISDLSQEPYIYFVGMKDNSVMCATEDRRTWEYRNAGFHPSADVFSLELVDSGFYYAGTENGIYKTIDGGLNWVFIGLYGKRVNDILLDSTLTSTIWAATSEGLFKSSDAGSSWTKRYVKGIFNQNIIMLTPIPGSNDIYIGTDGGDMIRWSD